MTSVPASKIVGRVLVVDDDRSARLLLERVLTRAGHHVVLADNADFGLKQLASLRFDLVITDKNLPGIDGLEVLKRARSSNKALQVILMTGFPTPETKAHASELGVFAYVTKPFGVHDILDVCNEAIRAARSVDAD